ncbi:hypothetical protein DPMN_103459 [Dreissena polymorpha]|uniref:Uncharacterized protein n=1 Tax=Dreissena polymorpha TaxID=45954 RepID=A0A9D4HA33_DREPO|nr:hypothetical protein DPMN_103459 [Dreissena polymorpha]
MRVYFEMFEVLPRMRLHYVRTRGVAQNLPNELLVFDSRKLNNSFNIKSFLLFKGICIISVVLSCGGKPEYRRKPHLFSMVTTNQTRMLPRKVI